MPRGKANKTPEETQELKDLNQGSNDLQESQNSKEQKPNEESKKPEVKKPEETQELKASSYVVEIDFYSKEKKKFEKGQDVSHFPKERLAKLVERGIVLAK